MRIEACRTCGTEFEIHGRQPFKYCERHRLSRQDAQNRAQRNKRQRKRAARSPVQCVVCGKEFLACRSDAKTCSAECKRQESNRRAREWEHSNPSKCVDCGVTVLRRSKHCRDCGDKIRIQKATGPGNYAWKGGRTTDRHGYIHLLVAPEARKGHRYQPEHRLVWKAANGPIPEDFIIHHINGVKDDNRLENLEAMPRKKHNHRHEEHDKRILELEEEVRLLRARLGE